MKELQKKVTDLAESIAAKYDGIAVLVERDFLSPAFSIYYTWDTSEGKERVIQSKISFEAVATGFETVSAGHAKDIKGEFEKEGIKEKS